jgi:hypothetical protein
MTLAGFPHSGISGSTPTCGSPKLIAAYRALLRLSVPRHPPCALLSLDRICSLVLVRDEATRSTYSPSHTLGALEQITQIFSYPIPNTRIFKSTLVRECFAKRSTSEHFLRAWRKARHAYSPLQKGGDPAAGSPTATLLRLRPSHRARLRPLRPLRVRSRTSGTPGSHGVTGGVYKARERIHRGVADPRLLAIPASCSRVTDCNPNLDRLFPIRSASRHRNGLYRPL